jgi:hypothetical protein
VNLTTHTLLSLSFNIVMLKHRENFTRPSTKPQDGTAVWLLAVQCMLDAMVHPALRMQYVIL